MLSVALVGCGKIADAHAAQILRVGGCRLVAVCDREPLMAQQLAERFPIAQCFTDVGELLAEARPDVVHITTPPHSHVAIARECLQRGCHVYVEKPFTVHEAEARELVALAEGQGLKLTVGHDQQFSHAARRLRALVRQGYLGGRPVHMESYYGYDLGDSGYARALLGDPYHWVRRLPGRLLHNIISHGIARIAEFWPGDTPQVMAHGFVSPWLRSRNESEIMDELRVIITDGGGSTAYFTVSSQMRPSLHQFRLYGERNGLLLDQDQETVIRVRGRRFTSYAETFLPPAILATQHLGNLAHNVRRFLARDFHMLSGMKYLIEAFYGSIVQGTPVPIPYREILLTARIADAIVDQLGTRRSPPSEDVGPGAEGGREHRGTREPATAHTVGRGQA